MAVCEHKYEVSVVVASECALGVPLSLGAVVGKVWRWTVMLFNPYVKNYFHCR